MIANLINSNHEIAHFHDTESDRGFDLPIICWALHMTEAEDGTTDSYIVAMVIFGGEITEADFITGFTGVSNTISGLSQLH